MTSTVQQGTVLATVSASGTLEAAQNLGLNFTTGGKVTALYVKVGQRVTAGQMLAKVDPTASKDSLDQAQAAEAQQSVTAAQDTLSYAQQNLYGPGRLRRGLRPRSAAPRWPRARASLGQNGVKVTGTTANAILAELRNATGKTATAVRTCRVLLQPAAPSPSPSANG